MRFLILLFLCFHAQAQFSSSTTTKVDVIRNNATSNVTLSPSGDVVLTPATASKVIFADADKKLKSATYGPTDVITKNPATNEVLINGFLNLVSTTQGSVSCPVMTEAQRNLIATPATGECVFNSNSQSLNVYDGATWKSAGGGISQWVTAFNYSIDDIVVYAGEIYQSLTAHTSGTFTTDLANGEWVKIADTVQSQGLKDSSSATYKNVAVPNKQATTIGSNAVLLENGNQNLLSNPSFEHATYDTGWTCTGDSVESRETTVVIDGNASLETDATADTFECYQDTTLYEAQLSGVQGQASVWVRTNDVTVQVCARQAGTTLTGANCVTVNANNEWKEYIVPFVMGTTSNGISIKGTSGTGTTYIDNAYVGIMPANRIPDIQNITQWTDYGAMTITGTTTNPTKATTRQEDKVRCREIGQDYECEYRLSQTSGAGGAAGSGGYIFHLPSGIEFDSTIATMANKAYTGALTNAQSADVDLTRMGIGYGFVATASTANSPSPGRVVPTSSTTFQVFPLNNLSDLRQVSSGSYPLSDNNLAYFFSLKFRGKNLGSKSKIYSQQCTSDLDCENNFTAKVSIASVVSDENLDWINGNCSGTYPYVCTFNFNPALTVAPNCIAVAERTSAEQGRVLLVTSTTTTVSVTANLDNGTASTSEFTLYCQKAGSDFKQKNVITGTFANVVTAPNIAKPKTCYYAFGGASATLASPTECTTGTCVEVYDNCNAGTPPTHNATALYTDLTFANGTWKASVPIVCKCIPFDLTATEARECAITLQGTDNTWSTNASGGFVTNFYTTNLAGTQLTSYVLMECTADAP